MHSATSSLVGQDGDGESRELSRSKATSAFMSSASLKFVEEGDPLIRDDPWFRPPLKPDENYFTGFFEIAPDRF